MVLTLLAVGLSACSGGGMKLTAYFDDSGDLQSRGGVQVADVRVGKITRITLTKDFRAKVEMTLKPGIRVPKNSEALLRTTSLLGEKFVELRALGNPSQGPFLANGDTVTQSAQAPELEFVAEAAVQLLGGVNANSVASMVDTGAQGFANRGPQLRALIVDLNSISATLASRTTAIGQVIDNLDRATQTLAGGAGEISNLLVNLAQTSQILANNREQAVTALAALTHLATASDYSLQKYGSRHRPPDQTDRRHRRRPGQRQRPGRPTSPTGPPSSPRRSPRWSATTSPRSSCGSSRHPTTRGRASEPHPGLRQPRRLLRHLPHPAGRGDPIHHQRRRHHPPLRA